MCNAIGNWIIKFTDLVCLFRSLACPLVTCIIIANYHLLPGVLTAIFKGAFAIMPIPNMIAVSSSLPM